MYSPPARWSSRIQPRTDQSFDRSHPISCHNIFCRAYCFGADRSLSSVKVKSWL